MSHRFHHRSSALILALAWAIGAAPCAFAQFERSWAYEYTSQTGQYIEFYNLSNVTNPVTVQIYNPSGTLHSTQTVSLRAYEEITITDPATTWGLPVTANGTAATDRAYGILATAANTFSVIVEADRQQIPGTGRTAIHPQGFRYTDAWWGMYNYPSGGDETKDDHFFLFNPNASPTTVTIAAYNSAGTLLGTTVLPSLGAFQTRRVYPKQDLGIGAGVQNIGLHLTATLGVAIDVTTSLASQWSFNPGPYSTHDNVSGQFVAQETSRLRSRYIWENSRSSDSLAAERVTNPNASSVTCTKTIYVYDGSGPVGGNSYQVVTAIPAFATVELGQPPLEAFKNEVVSSPNFHSFALDCTANVAVHVSFEENIDVPLSPADGLTNFWWGVRDPSRTRQIFVVNPNDFSITIRCKAFHYVGATLVTESTDPPSPGTAKNITLGPRDALVTNVTDTTIGPGFSGANDRTITCFSADRFGIQLQEPDYGDVTPLVGGTDVPTSGLVSRFTARRSRGEVLVEWETVAETGTAGFYLERLHRPTREWRRAHEALLPALLDAPLGATYRFLDRGASPTAPLSYRLIEVESDGEQRGHGPFQIGLPADLPPRERAAVAADYAAEPRGRQPEVAVRFSQAQAEVEAGRGLVHRAAASHAAAHKPVGAKLAVRETGLHYVDTSQIAGLTGTTPAAAAQALVSGRVALTNLGTEVAWLPAPGGLYFYGEGLDSLYTRDNVYRLTLERGRSMTVRGAGAAAPTASSFVDTIHREEDVAAAIVVTQDPESDYWYWKAVAPGFGVPTQSFDLPAHDPVVASAVEARLELTVMGATNDPHHLQVRLNGSLIGERQWQGSGRRRESFVFSPSLLSAGGNSVEVTAILDAGATTSIIYIDSFDLTYERSHRAVGDRLRFSAAGPAVTVTGFSSPDLLLFDVTDARRPVLLTGAAIAPGTDGYQISFQGPPSLRSYLAVARAAVGPVAGTTDYASNLQRERDGAEYLVVAPDSLLEAAESLASYRESTGLDTMVVSLEDIYDEFSHGIATPHALRSFLAHAYRRWDDRPRYAVLVGKGSFDYRDLFGLGGNLMPPLMAPNPYGLAAADGRYGDVTGSDGVPEIAIGRLPVLGPSELEAFVGKLAAYEAAPAGAWQDRVLMAADDPDPAAGDFPADSEQLIASLPAGLAASRVYLGAQDLASARAATLAALGEGVVLFNYLGHGAMTQLAAEGLLTAADVASLANQPHLPVFTSLTCLAGRFEVPGLVSLGETMTVSPGGAIASFAPSGLSLNDEAVAFNATLLDALLTQGADEPRLGDAVRKALGAYAKVSGARFMLDVYNLLGDPATSLPGSLPNALRR